MKRKDFFDKITSVINDWKNTNFTFYPKQNVPGLDDSNLTYGNGEEKKGIEIYTCVLFVDIRNSVQLTKDKQVRTLGKVYSVFTYCILLAAQDEGGYVRNIIGDRVMVVFPPDNCYTKAVNCAITINQIASMIDKEFENFEFKCGIGIDYGKLSVMKVGIEKKGVENDDNKGLVWAGYPANFASRLTDCANKEFTEIIYSVDADFYELGSFLNPSLLRIPTGWYRITKELTAEELASSLFLSSPNKTLTSKSFRNPKSIKRNEKTYKYKPILVSEKVYQEYAKANSNDNDITKNLWKKQFRKIKDINFNVWGVDLYWDCNTIIDNA